jgi:hypothetical protein
MDRVHSTCHIVITLLYDPPSQGSKQMVWYGMVCPAILRHATPCYDMLWYVKSYQIVPNHTSITNRPPSAAPSVVHGFRIFAHRLRLVALVWYGWVWYDRSRPPVCLPTYLPTYLPPCLRSAIKTTRSKMPPSLSLVWPGLVWSSLPCPVSEP